MRRSLGLILLTAALAGCSRPPAQMVDLDEYRFEQSLKTCRERTINLVHDSPLLQRQAYFEQCMEGRGYGRETYRRRWINL